jgi:hypothetical protein
LKPIVLADISTPDAAYYKRILPTVYHAHLATVYRKDVRIWLWKTDAGRRAREAIAKELDMSKPVPDSSMSRQSTGENANRVRDEKIVSSLPIV